MNNTAALWGAVIVLGAYHGLNPAMGWPLAVANGLTERRGVAVAVTSLWLGAGHLAAMAVVLVPLALLAWLVEWSRAIRIGAGALVLLFGVWKTLDTRHPRALARIPPSRIAWWSFLIATAHGAGLMLVPFMLQLCAAPAADGGAIGQAHARMTGLLARSDVATALAVACVHTLSMLLAGLCIAYAVYRWLGLQFLRKAWFNLDRVWGASLALAGCAGIWMSL